DPLGKNARLYRWRQQKDRNSQIGCQGKAHANGIETAEIKHIGEAFQTDVKSCRRGRATRGTPKSGAFWGPRLVVALFAHRVSQQRASERTHLARILKVRARRPRSPGTWA